VPWLTQRGHLDLPPQAAEAQGVLEAIYVQLGGDLAVLGTARSTPLRGDFVHVETGTLIEIDESQHFSSARLQSLRLYPAGFSLGFEIGLYVGLCERWREQSDNYRKAKEARGFGAGGRQRQRAYYDALRDLATPALGHPPLLRIPAPDGNGAGAYRKHRESFLTSLAVR